MAAFLVGMCVLCGVVIFGICTVLGVLFGGTLAAGSPLPTKAPGCIFGLALVCLGIVSLTWMGWEIVSCVGAGAMVRWVDAK